MTIHTDHLHEALGHVMTDKRLDILRRIGEVGSISQAARDAGVSYKAAWQAVETLSNLAGSPLLQKAVGGSGGGGARLTQAGKQLLDAAERLHVARHAVVAQFDREITQRGAVNALALRTSMRNTLPCRVEGLKTVGGAVNVQLQLPDGQLLTSRITRESAQLLGLARGQSVLALCKAIAVNVGAPSETENSSLNRLRGQVARLPAAGRPGEVSVRLGADLHLVGFAKHDHGLRKGAEAWAEVDMAAVVVGLTG